MLPTFTPVQIICWVKRERTYQEKAEGIRRQLELISSDIMSANHHPRDLLAFDKISVTQPFWVFETAKSQIGIEDNVFLHVDRLSPVDEICFQY